MTQPAKAQEPSMEEILASIRRIIADEETAKPKARVVPGPPSGQAAADSGLPGPSELDEFSDAAEALEQDETESALPEPFASEISEPAPEADASAFLETDSETADA